jgi:hypothetical protein
MKETQMMDETTNTPLPTETSTRQIRRASREYLAGYFGHEWVQHPAGYAVYAPAGAEHYFTLMDGAIRRYPDAFIGAEPPSTDDLFECLELNELVRLLVWLNHFLRHMDGQARCDRWATLYGWAVGKREAALSWIETKQCLADRRGER